MYLPFLSRKKMATMFLVSLVFVFISYDIVTMLLEYAETIWEPYFIHWKMNDTISCHYVIEGNALPFIDDIVPPPDSIFFHDTTCRGGLNSRQACAVESVARIHPERNVYVLFNSPVSNLVLTRSCLAKLKLLKNVKLARLFTADYAKGTPLEIMLGHRENERSHFRIEHTADMLRIITMFKYGGVYLDTDMLVVKPLDALGKNWAAKQDDNLVNNAAIAFGRDELGHNLAATILADVKINYAPTHWVHNGPGALTRVLLKFCNTSTIRQLSNVPCHGFKVYDPKVIYPIHCDSREVYFVPGDVPASTRQAYTHHLWNKYTRDMRLVIDSPYDKLTKKHCPSIREMYGENFGT